MSEEKLPISESLEVLETITLYKTDKWWPAVALVDSFGRKQVAVYLWLNKDGKWKRQQKFVLHNKNEWSKIKEAVDKLSEKLPWAVIFILLTRRNVTSPKYFDFNMMPIAILNEDSQWRDFY